VKNPGGANAEANLVIINNYLKNPKDTDGVGVVDNKPIASLVTKGDFIIKETKVADLSKGRSLYNTVFGSSGNKISDPIPGVTGTETTLGVPNGISAQQLLDVWAENAKNGYLDTTNGYDYSQLFPKFLMGAKSYNQIVDKYLDEYVNTPGTKDNDKPYKDGVIYTGKEHSWDEGFGYFGAAANYGELTAEQNYGIKKRKAEYFTNADANGDGKVSLKTEYTSGLAYYAASFDKDGKSTYGKDIMNAFLQGRTVITNAVDKDGNARKLTDAERAKLVAYADTIQKNLELVLAEAVYKYAGGAHAKMDAYLTGTAGIGHETPTDADKDYYKQWGELKGFMLAMQYGGTGSKMTKAKFEEIDNLIGYGPVLSDGSQVTGLNGN
ncbi:MAG TPA: DUF4856 domain-containing protein, partial [Thiomicrospira sp.]|nr:DUF4856 domain-containing protein [Thiomicrospira sp.]